MHYCTETPGEGDVYDVHGDVRTGYMPWHSDLIYVDRINHGGALKVTVIPSREGYTGFIDKAALYAELDPELRRQIEDKEVVYLGDFDAGNKKYGSRVETKHLTALTARTQGKFVPVVHPATFVHPETGQRILNISPWTAIGLLGHEGPEGDALLDAVIRHCENESRAYFHSWKAGDVVVFDNWRMLHCAYGMPVGERRRMERTTFHGDYGLGRVAREGDVIPDTLRINV